MKIQASQAELLRAAFIASGVVRGSSTLPILNNVLIEANGSGVELRATDYDTRVRVALNATVIEPGAITVPAKTLADISKSLPAGEVVLENTGRGVSVTGGASVAHLTTMPARDFPAWPTVENPSTMQIPADVMRAIVNKVLPAAPIKDPRRVLIGVCLKFMPESITAVATDGKILSKLELPLSTGVDEDRQIILPWFLLQQVSKLVGDKPVTFSTDWRQVVLEVAGVCYTANAIDGKYPNYEAVIPRAFDSEIYFPRAEMLTTLKRVMVLGDRQNFCVDMNFDGGTCGLLTEDYDRGRFTDVVSATSGERFSVCFNYKLLDEALSMIDVDTVTMQANAPTTPVVFQGDEGLLVLVMPIKKTERAPKPEEVEAEA